MIKILKTVFILMTIAVDMYVLACIVIEPRWTVFGIELTPECWFITAIVMSLIILIHFLITIYQNEMANRDTYPKSWLIIRLN